MTANSQNLTFGEWLAELGFSPERWQGANEAVKADMRDAWQQGLTTKNAVFQGLPRTLGWETRSNS